MKKISVGETVKNWFGLCFIIVVTPEDEVITWKRSVRHIPHLGVV